MTTGGSVDRRLAILVITLLCSVLGGLLGMQWWYVSLEWHVLSVSLGAVISTGLAFVLTTERPKTNHASAQIERPVKLSPPKPSTYSWTPVPGAPIPQTARTRPAAPVAQRSEPERQPVAKHARIALPQATGIPSPSTNNVQSDLIAQCPRCGEFQLDVSEVAGVYTFQCRNEHCGDTWSWTPDRPWPPIVVRRNLPTASTPDGTGARRAEDR